MITLPSLWFSLFQLLLPLTKTPVITLGLSDTLKKLCPQRQLISNLNSICNLISQLTQPPRAGHLNYKMWCFWEVNDFLSNVTNTIHYTKWQHMSPSLCNHPLLFIKNRSLNPNRLDFKEQIESLIWLSTMQIHCSFPLAPIITFLIQVTMWIKSKGYLFGILMQWNYFH